MIRRYLAILRFALMSADVLSAVALFTFLVFIRFEVLEPDAHWDLAIGAGTLAVAYGIAWAGCLWLLGLYRLRTHVTFRGEAFGILRATILAGLAMFSLFFLLRLDDVSRLFLLLLLGSQPLLTIASRFALRQLLRSMRRRGLMTRQMLIVGAGPEARAFADEVKAHRDLGLEVIGHLSGPRDPAGAVRLPVLGTIDDIDDVLHGSVVDEVALCLSPEDWEYVEPVTRICEDEGKIVRVSMRALGGMLSGGQYEELGNTPIVTFLYGPDRLIGLALKRVFDIAASATAIVVLSPLLLGVALWIRLADGPPAVFSQRRVGLHGRPFTCFKFRTMVPDAEELFDDIAHLSEIEGPAFKMEDDPRITSVGRFLRRTSLDELPQLVNVLRGEMSIVGPRPAPPREVARYSIWHRRRLMMRPGLTGYWQVVARSDESFDRRAELDLQYIDRWSLWMDVKIILRTIPAIVSQPGR
jgi:exopolysaccharide biosynthesis polyprenyl glycosylphosphotransferase